MICGQWGESLGRFGRASDAVLGNSDPLYPGHVVTSERVPAQCQGAAGLPKSFQSPGSHSDGQAGMFQRSTGAAGWTPRGLWGKGPKGQTQEAIRVGPEPAPPGRGWSCRGFHQGHRQAFSPALLIKDYWPQLLF